MEKIQGATKESLDAFKLPSKLSPRIKLAWRISEGINCVILGLLFLVANAVLNRVANPDLAFWLRLCFVVLFSISVVWALVIGPWWRYLCWSYQIDQRFLLISHGIIFRKTLCIPFIRVQNTQIEQGPIFRLFGLGELTVSTAAGTHKIPGLLMEEANELRQTVAELARIAREDV